MSYLPIEDHGIIGNLHTAALVGTDGTIDWLCLPAFDSPSVFCSILDDEKGGHFRPAARRVHPEPAALPARHQRPPYPLLLARGLAEILDFMPISTRPGERHRLVRNVRVIRGRMDFRRRVPARPSTTPARDHSVSWGSPGPSSRPEESCLGLSTDVRLEERPKGAVGARFTLEEGERATFVLAHLEEGEGPGRSLSDVRVRGAVARHACSTGGVGSRTAPIRDGGGRWSTARRSSSSSWSTTRRGP